MKGALALLAPLLLAGCLADYTLPSDTPSARIEPAGKATPMVCVAERQQRLRPEADGYARIPAGRPVTLTAQFEGHDFVCIPAVSFVPEIDASYRQTFRVVSRSCTTTILRDSPRGPAMVATSAAASYGCRGRP